jgi:hypothetical protein
MDSYDCIGWICPLDYMDCMECDDYEKCFKEVTK